MPALPATPTGVVRSFLHHEASTDLDIHCRFDLAYEDGPPNTAQLASIAAAVSGAWGTHLASYLTSAEALYDVACADLANPDTINGRYTTPVDGTRSGTQNPNQVCAVLSFQPDRKYRGGKPKIFLPYLVAGDQSTPVLWTSGTISALATAWTAFIDELTGTTVGGCLLGQQVCVSYYGPPTVPATKGRQRLVSTQRTTPLVKNILSTTGLISIGSQRRRRGKV